MSSEPVGTGEQREWQIRADYPFGWDPADDQSRPPAEENEEIDVYDVADLQAATRRLRCAARKEIAGDASLLTARRKALAKALRAISQAKYTGHLRDTLAEICRSLPIEDTGTPSPLAIIDEALCTALILADSRVRNSQSIYPIEAGRAVYRQLQKLPKSVSRDEALISLMTAMTLKVSYSDNPGGQADFTPVSLVRERLALALDLPHPSRATEFFRAYEDALRYANGLKSEFLMSLPLARVAAELASTSLPGYERDIYRTCMWSIEDRLAHLDWPLGHDSVVELYNVFHNVLRLVISSARDLRGDLGTAYNFYTSFLDALAARGEFGLVVKSLEEHEVFFTGVMDRLRKELGGNPAGRGYPPSDLPLLLAIARAFLPEFKKEGI